MRTLEIDIPRRWRPTLHKQVTLPDRYEEMTPQQWVAVVALANDRINGETFYRRFFDIDSETLERIDPYQLWVLSGQLGFLANSKTPVSVFLIPEVEVTPADGIRIRMTAPAARLKGMTWQQFITADTFSNWYRYTKRKAYLYHFVASLYIEKGKDFAGTDIDKVADDVERGLDIDTMEAVLANWTLIRQWLADSYTSLFPRPLNDGKAADKKEKPASWLEIFDTLVQDDLTRLESYKTLEALDVIRILNRRIAERKKRKK